MWEDSRPLLEIIKVSKNFAPENGGRVTAVDNVSLALHSAQCLGIVGESGCGKSTLARLITCLEKPDSGQIFYKKQAIAGWHGEILRQYHRRVQIVFQNPSASFNPRMKIGSLVSEPLTNYNLMNKREAQKEAGRLMERVGLPLSLLNRYPHQLSGGEKQRAAIARAICLQPEVLICDEATSSLDVSIQAQVVELLAELHKEYGLSLIFISHDLALVKKMSHNIAVMYQGRIVELMDSCRLVSQAFHPYTRSLLASVLSVQEGCKDENTAINGIAHPVGTGDSSSGCSFYNRCPVSCARCSQEKPELRKIGLRHEAACHLTIPGQPSYYM